MAQNRVSQVVNSLGIRSMYHVRVECDVESYAWRVDIIQKSLWIFLDIFVGFLDPNCVDTSTPKYVDAPGPKSINSCCNQYS